MDSAIFGQSIIASIGTLIADAVTYPIELVATKVKSAYGRSSALKTTANVIKYQGIASLYKGFTTITWTAWFPNIVYFNLYEILKIRGHSLESQGKSNYSVLIPFFASMLAEVGFCAVMVPFDTIQTRMQMQSLQYQYRGLAHGLAEVIENEGFFRLFSASPLYVFQLLLYTPIQFATYEWLKARRLESKQRLSLVDSINYTIIATSIGAILTNPLNTLIVKFQVEDFAKENKNSAAKAMEIVRQSGMRELNKGLLVRLVERNINGLCYLPLYEFAGQYFNGEGQK